MGLFKHQASVPSWPSGVIRFDGETLEFGAGETRRVHVSCLRQIEIEPPRRGRLSLAIAYQAVLGKEKTGVWVEATHEAGLSELVAAARRAMPSQV